MPRLPSVSAEQSRLLKFVVRAGLSALIVGVLAYKINWASLGRVFEQMHVGLSVIAFVLLNVGQSFSSWRWKTIAEPLGFRESYSRYRTLYYIGNFFNLFLPTSVGGDAVRGWMLARTKTQRWPAFGSVIADRVAGVTAMLMMACVATLAPMGESPWWVPVLPWGILGCLFLTMALLPRLAGYSQKIQALVDALGWSKGRWGTWWTAIGLSFIVQGLATLQVILLGFALDLTVPWYSYLVVVPLVTLLTMVLPSLNGIGVREGGMVLLLAPFGVTTEQALALSLGWFALSVGVGLIGGGFYLFSDRSKEPADTDLSVEGKDSHESVNRRTDDEREGQRQAAA
ncbi:MAG: lysylphosphatidylglycerol synthase transmembrane domain-containing protein [Gemmatales bacterium]